MTPRRDAGNRNGRIQRNEPARVFGHPRSAAIASLSGTIGAISGTAVVRSQCQPSSKLTG
jgi:hypothetical protein